MGIVFTVALAATVYLLVSEIDVRLKALAAAMCLASLAMQFIPSVAGHVHIAVPAVIQLALALWGVIHWQS